MVNFLPDSVAKETLQVCYTFFIPVLLRYTDSAYPLGIFKLFLIIIYQQFPGMDFIFHNSYATPGQHVVYIQISYNVTVF